MLSLIMKVVASAVWLSLATVFSTAMAIALVGETFMLPEKPGPQRVLLVFLFHAVNLGLAAHRVDRICREPERAVQVLAGCASIVAIGSCDRVRPPM